VSDEELDAIRALLARLEGAPDEDSPEQKLWEACSALLTTYADLESRNDGLSFALDEHVAEARTLEMRLMAARTARRHAESDLDDMRRLLAGARAAADTAIEAHVKASERIADLEAQLDAMESGAKLTEVQIAKLESELGEAQAEVARLRQFKTASRRLLGDIAQRHADLTEAAGLVRAGDGAPLYRTHAELVDDVASLRAERDEMRAEVARLKPSPETQQALMTLCQDQGELTVGRRVDQLVNGWGAVTAGYDAEKYLRGRAEAEVERLKLMAPDPIVPDDETTLRQIARKLEAEHGVAAEYLVTAAELLRHFKLIGGRDG